MRGKSIPRAAPRFYALGQRCCATAGPFRDIEVNKERESCRKESLLDLGRLGWREISRRFRSSLFRIQKKSAVRGSVAVALNL